MDQPPPTVPPPEPSAGSRSEPPSPVRLPAGASVPLLLSAVGAGLLAVRLLGPGWAEGFPATWPDAVWPDESYLALAEQGPFRPGFWLGFRPPVYPLFCWALFRDSRLIVVAQTLLAAGSVAVLALTAARTLRSRPVAVPAVILIVAIPLQARYSQWHTQILSESLAASLGLLAIAAWWRFADRPSPRRAGLGAVTLAAWMLIRDAHVISAVAVLVPLLGLVAATGRSLGTPVRRALAATVAVIVVGAGYSLVAESRTHRARLSFHNTIGVRVLPDPELSRWFAARGMPLDDALRGRTGRSGLDDDFYRSEEPAFARYRQWVDGPGRRAMAWSLVALAPRYGSLLGDDLPEVLRGDVRYYDTHEVRRRLPSVWPGQLGGPADRTGLLVWLAVALGLLTAGAVATRRGDPSRRALVFAGALLALTAAELYTTWAGDPVELARHVVGADQRLAIGLVIATAVGLDALLGTRRRGPGSDDGDTGDGRNPDLAVTDDASARPAVTPGPSGAGVGA
ncbi:MAG: hypothetical protein ACKOBG_05780 [Actinomycetota bacterium]